VAARHWRVRQASYPEARSVYLRLIVDLCFSVTPPKCDMWTSTLHTRTLCPFYDHAATIERVRPVNTTNARCRGLCRRAFRFGSQRRAPDQMLFTPQPAAAFVRQYRFAPSPSRSVSLAGVTRKSVFRA